MEELAPTHAFSCLLFNPWNFSRLVYFRMGSAQLRNYFKVLGAQRMPDYISIVFLLYSNTVLFYVTGKNPLCLEMKGAGQSVDRNGNGDNLQLGLALTSLLVHLRLKLAEEPVGDGGVGMGMGMMAAPAASTVCRRQGSVG